jgi:hypothetical protein
MSNVKTVTELLDAYPYMFAGSNIGLTLHRGWYPTFAKLCDDIDALLGDDKRNFKWIQLKEKFGAARWYCHWDLREGEGRSVQIAVQQDNGALMKIDPNLNEISIQGLINLAEEVTGKKCIVCGEPAIIDSHRGWYQCLCKKHANKVFGGAKLPNYWFHIGRDDPNVPWSEYAVR